jgi:hypothetical protein
MSMRAAGAAWPGFRTGAAAQLHCCERGAGPVRPGGLLRPVRAGAELDVLDALDDARVAVDGEHPALAVEEGEDVVAEPEAGGEVAQDRGGDAQGLVALASLRQSIDGEDARRPREARVDVIGVPHAPPRVRDLLADLRRLDPVVDVPFPGALHDPSSLEARDGRSGSKEPHA